MAETESHVLRFGFHELAYMLAGQDGPSAARTREIMGIVDIDDQDGQAYITAGLSSLAARDLAVIEEEPHTIGFAAVVAHTLATARNWTSLFVRTRDQIELTVLVQGEQFSLLARQSPGNVTDFTPVKPGVTIAEATLELAVHYLDRLPSAAVMVRTASVDSEAALAVVRTEKAGWQLVEDPVFPGDAAWPAEDATGTDVDRSTAVRSLGELLRRFAVSA